MKYRDIGGSYRTRIYSGQVQSLGGDLGVVTGQATGKLGTTDKFNNVGVDILLMVVDAWTMVAVVVSSTVDHVQGSYQWLCHALHMVLIKCEVSISLYSL